MPARKHYRRCKCPAQLHVRQTPDNVAEPGWQAEGTRKSHPLVTVSFFAGPPEQKAQLVPTKESKRGKSPTATWKLERREQPYWVACEYGGTSAIATRGVAGGGDSLHSGIRPELLGTGHEAVELSIRQVMKDG